MDNKKDKKKKGHDNYVHFYTDEELKKLKKYDHYEKYEHYEKNAPIVQVGGTPIYHENETGPCFGNWKITYRDNDGKWWELEKTYETMIEACGEAKIIKDRFKKERSKPK